MWAQVEEEHDEGPYPHPSLSEPRVWAQVDEEHDEGSVVDDERPPFADGGAPSP